jgi:TPP-dependent 2-oxoacid decarboxylase
LRSPAKPQHTILTWHQAFVTPLSKSLVDETNPNFAGIYIGEVTPDTSAKEQLEASDVILYIGPLPSDSATGGFSYGLPAKAKITLHSDFVSIGEEKWEGLHFVPILKKLTAQLSQDSSGLTQAKPKAIVNAFALSFNAPFGEANIFIGRNKQHCGSQTIQVSYRSPRATPFLEVFRTLLSTG